MGRKIPGRKHRGVKDPEKQRAERFAKIKDKINTAPSNPDEQQIPSSLSKLIELKDKVKQGLFNKSKKTREKKAHINKIKTSRNKDEKPTPKFEQLPGESDREFKHRMSRICSEFIREAAFEEKYRVDIKRNEEGKVEAVVKRPKDELELLVKKLQKEKKMNKNKKAKKKDLKDGEQPKLTKSQKWALKKLDKKKKKAREKDQDYSFVPQKEEVKFGEIVHAPPNLTAPKKVTKLQQASRPGQKPLLLKSMLINNQNQKVKDAGRRDQQHKKTTLLKSSKNIDRKGKRKDLPHALRRQLDKQQKEIIESYKMLKSKKH